MTTVHDLEHVVIARLTEIVNPILSVFQTTDPDNGGTTLMLCDETFEGGGVMLTLRIRYVGDGEFLFESKEDSDFFNKKVGVRLKEVETREALDQLLFRLLRPHLHQWFEMLAATAFWEIDTRPKFRREPYALDPNTMFSIADIPSTAHDVSFTTTGNSKMSLIWLFAGDPQDIYIMIPSTMSLRDMVFWLNEVTDRICRG